VQAYSLLIRIQGKETALALANSPAHFPLHFVLTPAIPIWHNLTKNCEGQEPSTIPILADAQA